MNARRYVIVGDGAAGTTAAQDLRRIDPHAAILIVSDDPNPAYYRAALTNYLLGELREEQIWAVPPPFYIEHRIDRRLDRVTGVDPARSQLWLASGAAPLAFDALLVASGARARPPTFEGRNLPGVATMRTLQDARGCLEQVQTGAVRRAVVIGGGPLALEWAVALRERGAQVTMLVREARLMPGALDETASDLLVARLRQGGLDLRLREEVEQAIAGRSGRVERVVTKSGQSIPCELLGVAIGVVCNTEFLANSGIALGARGGVVVNAAMRASVPGVFAAGDVAELDGAVTQLWEPARRQGQVAAHGMAGRERTYAPGALYFATRLYDLDFAAVGRTGHAEDVETLVDKPLATGRIGYRKLTLKRGRLVGALMLGHREERVRARGKLYKQLIDGAIDVGAIARELLDPAFDLQGWLDTKELVQKPAARAPGGAVAAPAALLGTRAVNVDALLASPAAASVAVASPSAGAAALPARPPMAPVAASPVAPSAGAMLSIGFRVPPAAAVGGPVLGWLEGAGRRWDLGAPVVSIGRDPRGAIALQDASVSFVHAQITRHDDALYLRDVGSSNGTWINGKLAALPHRLDAGDRIRVGATELVFRSARAAAIAQPPERAPPPAPAAPVAAGAWTGAGVSSPAAPKAPASSAASLEIRGGPRLGLAFALRGPSVTLGRDPASAVRLDDIAVSRRHAVLSEHQGNWFVSDLHSSRGTYKNGARIAPGHDVPLHHGDQLQLGDTLLAFVRR